MPIPVTVFTGFLGSGKTTIILNLLKDIPENYKIVLLKNEFGNIAVDSLLAKEKNLEVTEMLNGCLCCILVGKLGNALEEIMANFKPDRIIIETSGSAYPAPIVLELKKLGEDRLKLDGVITVIDAINFEGYKDTSYTAKIQTEFTDLILINKHEEVSKELLDKVLDDVYALNPSTPKIKTNHGVVSNDLVFGLDTKLYKQIAENINPTIHEDHHHNEVEIIELRSNKIFTKDSLEEFLKSLPSWDFYRIKGSINLDGSWYLLNYAFGKWDYLQLKQEISSTALIFMGKNFTFHLKKIKNSLALDDNELQLI